MDAAKGIFKTQLELCQCHKFFKTHHLTELS